MFSNRLNNRSYFFSSFSSQRPIELCLPLSVFFSMNMMSLEFVIISYTFYKQWFFTLIKGLGLLWRMSIYNQKILWRVLSLAEHVMFSNRLNNRSYFFSSSSSQRPIDLCLSLPVFAMKIISLEFVIISYTFHKQWFFYSNKRSWLT